MPVRPLGGSRFRSHSVAERRRVEILVGRARDEQPVGPDGAIGARLDVRAGDAGQLQDLLLVAGLVGYDDGVDALAGQGVLEDAVASDRVVQEVVVVPRRPAGGEAEHGPVHLLDLGQPGMQEDRVLPPAGQPEVAARLVVEDAAGSDRRTELADEPAVTYVEQVAGRDLGAPAALEDPVPGGLTWRRAALEQLGRARRVQRDGARLALGGVGRRTVAVRGSDRAPATRESGRRRFLRAPTAAGGPA